MRTVATLTGGSRLVGRSAQLALLTIVELLVGLFTGRLGEALASLRAFVGLIPRTGAILRRRRAIRGQRVVPEREVLGLQDRGSSRLTSYLRGKETTTFVGAESSVRRWREASFGPLLAWLAVVLAVVIGSRSFLRNGVPAVGEFLPFSTGSRQLLADYRSSFDPRSFGSTSAVPTGWAAAGTLSALALFRMPLLMTMSVVGSILLGALGAWRLSTVFPSNRARIAGMVVYVATPLVPGVLSQGDWTALLWFATLPWLVHLARRAAAIGTADPTADVIDLVDGVGELSIRERVRAIAFASLLLSLAAAFAPVIVVLWGAAGLLVAVATLIAAGSWRVAAWIAGTTVVSMAVAALLNAPWSLDWAWAEMAGARTQGASGRSVFEAATLQTGSLRFAVLAVGLYVPVLAALAISRAWRLTWAVRGAALVLAFGAVLVLADRGELSFAIPRASLLAAPIALGLALNAAALAGGFETDILSRGFGWRQPVGLGATAAIVVGLVPGVLSIGNGSWNTPQTPLTTFLAAQLPRDPAVGDYRVLYVGDPRVLPVPGRELRPGIAYAVVDSGPLTFADRFVVPRTAGDDAVERALELAATGSTLRVGKLLAPLGIRYVVVPETDGVYSTDDDPIPVPSGLLDALQAQLDIGQVPGPPALEVFVNESWIPVGAQLTGETATASLSAGADVLVRADLESAVPSMVGADRTPKGANEVAPGVVHIAIPFDERLTLTVNGQPIAGRPGFGTATAFDVAESGTGFLSYTRDGQRSLWVSAQLMMWLAVLAVAAGARASFGRRRGPRVQDETLIDLGDEPVVLTGVAGEVLGVSAWGDDDPDVSYDYGVHGPHDGDVDESSDADDRVDPVVDLGGATPTPGAGRGPEARRAAARSTRRSRPNPIGVPPTGRALVRDTTPPSGIPRVRRTSTAESSIEDDDVDLAALVARVDADPADEPSGSPSDDGTGDEAGSEAVSE